MNNLQFGMTLLGLGLTVGAHASGAQPTPQYDPACHFIDQVFDRTQAYHLMETSGTKHRQVLKAGQADGRRYVLYRYQHRGLAIDYVQERVAGERKRYLEILQVSPPALAALQDLLPAIAPDRFNSPLGCDGWALRVGESPSGGRSVTIQSIYHG